jgi:parvulin-like peptidyl-prolyl isomerase
MKKSQVPNPKSRNGNPRLFFRASVLACWLFCFFAMGYAAETPDSVKVVATVNDEPITTTMVVRELVRIHTAGAVDTSRAGFSLDKLVQRLINDRLLEQEARSVGLAEDSAVMAKVGKFRDQITYRILLKTLFPDTFTASDDEIRAEYAKDFQRFDVRTLCMMDSAMSAALADSIRHGAPFANFTARYSIDKYKDSGGLGGTYTLLDLPTVIQDQALASKPGDLLGPTYMWRAFVLMQIEKKLEPDTAEKLDSVRANVERAVITAKRTAALRTFAESLKTKFPVAVDSAILDSLPIRFAQGLTISDRPVITVGGIRTITESDLRDQYMYRLAGNPSHDVKKMLADVVTDEIQGLLLQAEASEPKFAGLDEVQEPVKAFEDSVLVIAYLQDVVAENVKVSPDEISAFYDLNKNLYRDQGRYKIATITRKSEQEAEDDYQKLLSGTDFTWLARHHSTDEARDQGGERDWMTVEMLPADVGGSLDTMKIGSVTKPVQTPTGQVIVKLLDRQQGAIMTLDRVKGSIEATLTRKKQLEAIDDIIKKLRASAEIKIEENVINELRITGTKS